MTPKRLAKWLRDHADEIDNGGPFYSKSVPLRNAADALEAKDKEIAELREVLKPFADIARKIDADPNVKVSDHEDMIPAGWKLDLPLLHFRAARAKLEGSGT